MQFKTSCGGLSFVSAYFTLKETKRSWSTKWSSKPIFKCFATVTGDCQEGLELSTTQVSSHKLPKSFSENLISYSFMVKSSNAKNTFILQWLKTSWKSCSSVNSLLKKAWIFSGTRRRLVSLGFSNSKNKSLPFISHERSVDELIT